jgi:hypothetical protein
MESQRTPLDKRQGEYIGELLRDGHRGEHGIFAELFSRLAVGKALGYVKHDLAAARYQKRNASTPFSFDVATDHLDDTVGPLDVEA